MSTFWSLWIIVLTTVCTGAVTWLLFANRKSRGTGPDKTTGHIYDGIEEYDNPLPAWWFYLFVISIVFGVGYLIAYPGFGAFKGVLGWTSHGEVEKQIASAEKEFGPLFAKYAQLPLAEVAKDPQALKMGQRIFLNNCAQCHGSDAQGNTGFPNLTDNDWLYGGAPEQIIETISNGRRGAMPAWGSALGDAGVQEVAAYVVSLNGRDSDKTLAAAGQQKFAMFCVACHGADGKGNQAMGAPNLTDKIWLYGGSLSTLQQTIHGGRNGQMPAWNDILGPDKVHIVAAYVYSLSHAEE
jgi:cytochrome c oxidase cbb3-type subunit 3